MKEFFNKYPFLKLLTKRVVVIIVTWVTIIGCLFATVAIALPSDEYETTYDWVYGDGTNELLSIKINGTIVGSEGENSFWSSVDELQTSGYTVKEQLYAAADDDLINGVILEINSPGGTIYGARAIADGVSYYREQTGNPVYAYVEGLGASGAYWAAASTDKIIADYGSDVGSIGIVMGPFQYYDQLVAEDGGLLTGGVITQNGIENVVLTAGKSKDVGSPYRRLTNEEIASFQKALNNEYDNFVGYVSERRKIADDQLRNVIGAMVYDNKTAQEYKLIDKSGSREDAYVALAEAAGIEDDFQIMRESYIPGFVESLLTATIRKPSKQAVIDTCSLTRSKLAYHGDVSVLCLNTTKQ